MKRELTISTIIIIFFVFLSCSKYDDGPFISLRSPEQRIVGEYILNTYIINNESITLSDDGISEYRVIYNKDGSGKSFITRNNFPNESEFEWELDKKKKHIRERYKSQNNEWGKWSDYNEILKLTKTEFWYANNIKQETTEFHFIKQ